MTVSSGVQGTQRSTPGRAARDAQVRVDIQGLRAVAVTLVVLYHLWPNRLTGGFVGVDVFFVISGFLISSHLLAHPPTRARDLAVFWSRRIRRLLPASLLVLAITTIATYLVAPASQWHEDAKQIGASALYGVNWLLASDSVDYLKAQDTPSPVQHYWSLSVEEQFYLIWPLLILALVLLARRIRANAAVTVGAGLAAVVAASLAYSVHATATAPASAYFVTPTRIWELGAGGLLAVALARRALGRDRTCDAVPLPAWARALLGWAGLAAMVAAAVWFRGSTPFPGWHAALPVAGAAAVIAARPPRAVWSPGLPLGWRPARWLGDVSYSVYLWHWPLIALLPYVSGGSLGRLDKAVIIAGTLLLAGLSKRFVEDPLRARPTGRGARQVRLRRPYALAAAGMVVVVGLAGAMQLDVTHRQSVARAALARALAGHDPCFGAAALAAPAGRCAPTTKGPVVPAPAQAVNDKPAVYFKNCWAWPPFHGLPRCTFGDPHGTISIALAGNSHAGEWLPALDAIAKVKGWRITTFLGSACPLTGTPLTWDTRADQAGCLAWGRKVLNATSSGRYDLVVTSERNVYPAAGHSRAGSFAAWRQGYRGYLHDWLAAGRRLLVIHDTPFPATTVHSIPDCIDANSADLATCGGPRDRWVPADPLVAAARSLHSTAITTVDLNDHICGPTVCPAAVGGVTVYFDGSHLTATYCRTLAPYLASPLVRAVQRATGG